MLKFSRYFIPYIIILFILGFDNKFILSFIIVLLHEFIHYLTALYFGFSGFDVEILPIGGRLVLQDLDEATPKEDLIISLSGPAANIIFAAVFYLIGKYYRTDIINSLCLSNLSIGIINLLPAFPLDGGRAFRDLLTMKNAYKKANKITIYLSTIIGVFLTFYSFVNLLSFNKNISLGIISIFILMSSVKERERMVYLIMGDIIKKKARFKKWGYIENREISIYYKKSLLNALALIDKYRYGVFLILNDELRVLDIIYEEEILEAIKVYGNITLENLINIK